ncbi:MAG: hypothetical protein K2P69_16610, partial [Eubacterium sp.]|nr:hypothetical protein [Eubacterium sp.]
TYCVHDFCMAVDFCERLCLQYIFHNGFLSLLHPKTDVLFADSDSIPASCLETLGKVLRKYKD